MRCAGFPAFLRLPARYPETPAWTARACKRVSVIVEFHRVFIGADLARECENLERILNAGRCESGLRRKVIDVNARIKRQHGGDQVRVIGCVLAAQRH